MRDLMLMTPTDKTQQSWCLDFDIINGVPKFVPEERNTQDQRAAVAAYMFRGTIPGKPELGVEWASIYQDNYNETLITVDNEVKQAIQQYAAVPEGPNTMYVPIYDINKDGGVELAIYQG